MPGQALGQVGVLDGQPQVAQLDPGEGWASVEGEGDTAVVTFGSCTGPVREALANRKMKLVSIRLLSPAQPERLKKALEGVKRVLVVEQNHSGQFLRYLRSEYELPGEVKSLRRPGPMAVIEEVLRAAKERPGRLEDGEFRIVQASVEIEHLHLLVEAKDDRIVIDLMKHPKFASDSRLKLALGLVVPLVTIGAIETDPEHLDVAFRPLPKGVSEVVKGVRRAVGR